MGNLFSNQVNNTDIQQDFINNFINTNQASCIADPNVVVKGTVVTVSGSTVSGDVVGVSVTGVSSDASCMITNDMENNITNIIDAKTKQSNAWDNSIFGGFNWFSNQVNNADYKSTVKNNIVNTNVELCEADTTVAAINTYVYVKDSRVGGNVIGVKIDDVTATASCTMANYMKNTTYNKAQITIDQSNTSINSFFIIAAIIALVVIIIVIIVLVTVVSGIFKRPAQPQMVPGIPGVPGVSGIPQGNVDPELIRLLTATK